MKYYIAADGGGTKLVAILYDASFRIIKSARMSGTNCIGKTGEQIRAEMCRFVDALLPEEITEIHGLDLCILKYEQMFIEVLRQRCQVNDVRSYGEDAAALAACGQRHGVVAQAGTGSEAFLNQPGVWRVVGGWGFMVGDEGSGYDIGLQTLKSAIYAWDGRGPQTAILKLLLEDWDMSDLWMLVERLTRSPDYKQMIASASHITAKAAGQGDPIALEIYERAAHAISAQVLTVIAKNGGSWEGPVVVSGGAWKGSGHMFEVFCKDIRSVYPKAQIIYPIFEPVVGCAILRRLDAGEVFEDFSDCLQIQFEPFLYFYSNQEDDK